MSPNTHNVPTLTSRYILFPYNTALASCIPDGVNGIFSDIFLPSHYGPGFDTASNRN